MMDDETRAKVSKSYFKLLCGIDWSDDVLVRGIREGLNKFLSNATEGTKYDKADYESPEARRKIEAGDRSGLIYEHMVPKQLYIQAACVEHAKAGALTEAFIDDLLKRYWKTAIVTRGEAARLYARRMPDDWDGTDVHARYIKAGIDLVRIS
jgi:hypothetical protein